MQRANSETDLSAFPRNLIASDERTRSADDGRRTVPKNDTHQKIDKRELVLERYRQQREKERERESKEEEEKERAFQTRLFHLLKLKQSTQDAHLEIKASNEKRSRKAKILEKRHEREKEGLLAAGQNPYEVWRRQEREEQVANQLKLRELHMQQTLEAARKSIDTAKKRFEKDQRKYQKEKEFMDKWRKEMNTKAHEERASQYIQTHTGKEFLDPVHKEFILLPSKLIKPEKLSKILGHNKLIGDSKEIVESIPTNLPQLEESDQSQAGMDSNSNSVQYSKSPEKSGIMQKSMSRLEQQMLDRAKQTMKDNITRPQVVMQKEFKGDSFTSKPEKIIFKDFEVGKQYKQKILLTNVSFSFNSFKLLGLAPRIRDFFKIDYKLPGRMSAGTSVTIKVTFIPLINEDIDDHLPILAETGLIKIPLICETKKCKITVAPFPVVEFPRGVPLGEVGSTNFKVINEGAIETSFVIRKGEAIIRAELQDGRQFTASYLAASRRMSRNANRKISTASQIPRESGQTVDSASSEQIELGEQLHECFQFGPSEGEYKVEPYGQTIVDVRFAPILIGCTVEQKCVLSFTDHKSPDVFLVIRGRGEDIEVYMEQDETDFQLCQCDYLYRDTITLFNRGNTSHQFFMEVPRAFSSFLECIPTMGYVQPETPASVLLKFRPSKEILVDHKYMNLETGQLVLPIRVRVPAQSTPLNFTFKAQITVSELEFSPSILDFGECPITESISLELTITNKALIPQRYGFLHVKKEVQITPGDGFGMILPKESIVLQVIFSPTSATIHKFDLHCSTLDKTFQIPCKGVGIKLPLNFSHSLINFGTVCYGSSSRKSLKITNTSKVSQKFQLIAPSESMIKIHNGSGTLQPNQAEFVSIEFTPLRDSQLEEMKLREKSSMEQEIQKAREEAERVEKLQIEVQQVEKSSVNKRSNGKKKPVVLVSKNNDPAPVLQNNTMNMQIEQILKKQAYHCLVQETLAKLVNRWKNSIKVKLPVFFKSADGKEPFEIQYLEVEGCFCENVYSLGTMSSPLHPEQTPESEIEERSNAMQETNCVNFGTVPIGNIITKEVTITNHCNEAIELAHLPLLSPYFTVVNAMRPIPPGKSHSMLLKFSPDKEKTFVDTLEVHASGNPAKWSSAVTLKGRGVNPLYRVEPSFLHLGVTMAKEVVKKSFKLTNVSGFDVTYRLDLKRDGEKNINRINPFNVVPCQVVLTSGEEKEIVVHFLPDHEHYMYTDTVVIGGTDGAHQEAVVRLEGGCSGTKAVYVHGPLGSIMEHKSEDKFSIPQGKYEVLDDEIIVSFQVDKTAHRHIQLTFNSNGEKASLQSIEIGSTRDKKGGPVEYILEWPVTATQTGFSLTEDSPSKGTIAPGQAKIITFQFLPMEAGLGQRREVAIKGFLKGPDYSFTVTLVGYT